MEECTGRVCGEGVEEESRELFLAFFSSHLLPFFSSCGSVQGESAGKGVQEESGELFLYNLLLHSSFFCVVGFFCSVVLFCCALCTLPLSSFFSSSCGLSCSSLQSCSEDGSVGLAERRKESTGEGCAGRES